MQMNSLGPAGSYIASPLMELVQVVEAAAVCMSFNALYIMSRLVLQRDV